MSCLAHDYHDGKLYCGGDSDIFVFDCRADTIAKVIHVGGRVQTLDWYPAGNKLYAIVCGSAISVAAVVDCSRDTVVKYLPLNDSGEWGEPGSLLIREFDQLWLFAYGQWYAVVDCRTDSIVKDTMIGMLNHLSASCSPADRKLYATGSSATGCGGLCVLDVDSRLPEDSIMFSPDTCSVYLGQVYVAAEARKVYCDFVAGGFPPQDCSW